MSTQSAAFVAIAEKCPDEFGAVRDLAAALFALRDAMANELGHMSDRAKAAFATADAVADATVLAIKAVDDPESLAPAVG